MIGQNVTCKHASMVPGLINMHASIYYFIMVRLHDLIPVNHRRKHAPHYSFYKSKTNNN